MRKRVKARARATWFHARRIARSFTAGGTLNVARDIAFLWLALLVVSAFQCYSASAPSIFEALFEIVSAFGNVGLSLGSKRRPCASFSADLSVASQVGCETRGACGPHRRVTTKRGRTHDSPLLHNETVVVVVLRRRPNDARRPTVASPGRGRVSSSSQVVLMVVMVVGRTRDLPSSVDSALSVRDVVPVEDMLRRNTLQGGRDEDTVVDATDVAYVPTNATAASVAAEVAVAVGGGDVRGADDGRPSPPSAAARDDAAGDHGGGGQNGTERNGSWGPPRDQFRALGGLAAS